MRNLSVSEAEKCAPVSVCRAVFESCSGLTHKGLVAINCALLLAGSVPKARTPGFEAVREGTWIAA